MEKKSSLSQFYRLLNFTEETENTNLENDWGCHIPLPRRRPRKYRRHTTRKRKTEIRKIRTNDNLRTDRIAKWLYEKDIESIQFLKNWRMLLFSFQFCAVSFMAIFDKLLGFVNCLMHDNEMVWVLWFCHPWLNLSYFWRNARGFRVHTSIL